MLSVETPNQSKKSKSGKQRKDSDEELFGRGESIELTETMRRDINRIQQMQGGASGLGRYNSGDDGEQEKGQEEEEYDDEEEEEV